jgi:chromosome segregation ATPase
MDANQLNELATNAQLDHWPAHLGVTTDAEKVEYLAARLREVATEHANELEAAEQREESLESDNIDLSNENDKLKEQLETLRTENEELKAKLA